MGTHVLHGLAVSVVSAAMLACPAMAGESGNEQRPTSHRVSPSLLPKGTPCTVRLLPETKAAKSGQTDTISIVYKGRVAEASDTGLTLTVTESLEAIRRTSPASRLPYVGPLFSSHGIRQEKPAAGEEKRVSIPVEKIQSITLSVNEEPGPRSVAR